MCVCVCVCVYACKDREYQSRAYFVQVLVCVYVCVCVCVCVPTCLNIQGRQNHDEGEARGKDGVLPGIEEGKGGLCLEAELLIFF